MIIYGTSNETDITSELLDSLDIKLNTKDVNRTIKVNCGSGSYIYYAFPVSLGAVGFWQFGIVKGGFKIPIRIEYDNTDYKVFRSVNLLRGIIEIQIIKEDDTMKLKWDESGKRLFETGVKKGVLYVQDPDGSYPKGVAWNGLTAVTESPSGAEPTNLYADDIKYLSLTSAEDFGATIEAYTYPDEFRACNGEISIATGVVIGQQKRNAFGMCYTTTVGNDIAGNDYGYKIHIVYGAKAAPSEANYGTINESPDAITFSWSVSTTPLDTGIPNMKPTATLVIDSTLFTTSEQKAKLKALEDVLYGTDETEPSLPLPSRVLEILGAAG